MEGRVISPIIEIKEVLFPIIKAKELYVHSAEQIIEPPVVLLIISKMDAAPVHPWIEIRRTKKSEDGTQTASSPTNSSNGKVPFTMKRHHLLTTRIMVNTSAISVTTYSDICRA
jgi:hypothetical protein